MTLCVRVVTLYSTATQISRLLESVQYNTHPIDSLTKPVDPNKNLQLTEVMNPMMMVTMMMMLVMMTMMMTGSVHNLTDEEDVDEKVSDWQRSLSHSCLLRQPLL